MKCGKETIIKHEEKRKKRRKEEMDKYRNRQQRMEVKASLGMQGGVVYRNG